MKKKVGNRLIALLLALFMAVTMMPDMAVGAEETDNSSASTERKCGYEQPEFIYVEDTGDVDIDKPMLYSAQYNTADASYWSLYGSNYYYGEMTSEEKKFYDALYNVNMAFLTGTADADYIQASYCSGFVSIGNLDDDTAKRIAQIVQMSNPQFYFANEAIMCRTTADGKHIRAISLCVYDDFANGIERENITSKIKVKLDTWVASIKSKATILDMEQEAHDIIMQNCWYSEEGNYHQSSAGVLLEGKAVCAGYAETFEMLCNAVGIQTVCVTSSSHEWNKVKLYGRWYVVDCTWDDDADDTTGTVYSYWCFNVSDNFSDEYGKWSHTAESWWSSYSVPVCENDKVITNRDYNYQGVDYSSVFDVDYYLKTYPDIKAAFGADENQAFMHFINCGMAEGRQGKSSFNVISYKNRYKDLRMTYGNNLRSYYLHYISNGKAEGRKATGDVTITDGVSVYNGVDYSAVYNYSYYIKKYPDIAKAFPNDDISTLAHFVTYGMNEKRQGNMNFDVNSYYNQYADLRSAFGTNWRAYYLHYIQNGKAEGRKGTGTKTMQGTTVYNGVDYSAVYNMSDYLNKNTDVKKAVGGDDLAAIAHFVNYGMKEGRQASSKFDVNSYRMRYKDLRSAFGYDLASYYYHYMSSGKAEGRQATGKVTDIDGVTVYNGVDYAAVYNFNYYVDANPDIKAAFGNDDLAVLSHFVNYGMKEGRRSCEAFNVLTYREKNGDLKAAFGDDLKQYYIHYINYGKNEGRKAA